jgi:hypothetical protein
MPGAGYWFTVITNTGMCCLSRLFFSLIHTPHGGCQAAVFYGVRLNFSGTFAEHPAPDGLPDSCINLSLESGFAN